MDSFDQIGPPLAENANTLQLFRCPRCGHTVFATYDRFAEFDNFGTSGAWHVVAHELHDGSPCPCVNEGDDIAGAAPCSQCGLLVLHERREGADSMPLPHEAPCGLPCAGAPSSVPLSERHKKEGTFGGCKRCGPKADPR